MEALVHKHSLRNLLMLMSVVAVLTAGAWAQQWTPLGPDGGDGRSLAHDPKNPDHLFVGTSSGTVFRSQDGGRSWTRFAHLGDRDDYVLDHIIVDSHDSSLLYVAAWSIESQAAGDVFRSKDGGKNWQTLSGMRGKSVRALAQSASDHKVLVAGALDGVYRTKDGGDSWEKISPNGHAELKNFESIAIDPKDPNVVYAGTWHLPWKTNDGGQTWHPIKKGMIDDSDVFSIIVSPDNPSVVFASACSGIYKSESAGELFSKIQGIPFSARRTRVLHQDSSNPNIVYAGTTEGLWKTSDLGKTWKRVTNPSVVVNDVFVDPRNSQHVILATDRSGLLASGDGAQTWLASNQGFTHRTVTAILVDRKDPSNIYVGLVNDREFGGVFASTDGGQHWQQRSAGLGGRDVFSLEQAANGTLIAGTNRGVFTMARNAREWQPVNTVVLEKTATRKTKVNGKMRMVESKSVTRTELAARVNGLDLGLTRWAAATSSGLYTSSDQGKTWMGGPVMGRQDFVSVGSNANLVVAATHNAVLVSSDSGKTWKLASPANYITKIYGVTVTPDAQVFVASREGAFHSSDNGGSWEHMMTGLPSKEVANIVYDENRKRLLATSNASGIVFESTDSGRSWQRKADLILPIRALALVQGRLVGATPYFGVVAQPENQPQSAAAAPSEGSNR